MQKKDNDNSLLFERPNTTTSQDETINGTADQPQFTIIDRDEWVKPGLYVTAQRADDQLGIEEQDTLLISDLNWVDHLLHSIEVRSHPRHGRPHSLKIIREDFYDLFEAEPKGEAIREREIKELQQEISGIQNTIAKGPPEAPVAGFITDGRAKARGRALTTAGGFLQSGPKLSSPSVGQMLANPEGAVNLQIEASKHLALLQDKKNWLVDTTKEMNEKVGLLGGYFSEKAIAIQGSFSDQIKQIDSLNKSLANFQLYTGESVALELIRDGNRAPDETPLTIYQRKLWMDEESLINAAYGGLERKDIGLFTEYLARNDELVNRILPAEKSVVLIGYSRQHREYYNDRSAYEVGEIMRANTSGYLLIRNGEKIWRVLADIALPSAARLFPQAKDLEKPFKGWRGEDITMEDLNYDRCHDEMRATELQFQRILVALWGLNDREAIFGDSWCQHPIYFGSLAFQEAHFEFVADDYGSGTTIGEERPSFREWLKLQNEKVASGSRIAARWNGLITETTARSCYSSHIHHDIVRTYDSKEGSGIKIVSRTGSDHFVKTKVAKNCYAAFDNPDHTFNASVLLNEDITSRYICIDRVTIEDIDYYLNSREQRSHYIDFVPLFMMVRKQLVEDTEWTRPFFTDLCEALDKKKIKYTKKTIAENIARWRCSKRGAPLPRPGQELYKKTLTKLVAVAKIEASTGENHVKKVKASFEEIHSEKVLRTSRNAAGAIIVYSEVNQTEQDDLNRPYPWIKKYRCTRMKEPFNFEYIGRVHAGHSIARETLINEHEDITDYIQRTCLFPTFTQEKSFFELVQNTDRATALLDPQFIGSASWDDIFNRYKADVVNRTETTIAKAFFVLPVGLKFSRASHRTMPFDLIALSIEVDRWLYFYADAPQRRQFDQWVKNYYQNPRSFLGRLHEEVNGKCAPWRIANSLTLSDINAVRRNEFNPTGHYYYTKLFENWPLREALAKQETNDRSNWDSQSQSFEEYFLQEIKSLWLPTAKIFDDWAKKNGLGQVSLSEQTSD